MLRHSVSFGGCRLASLDDIRSFDLPVRTRDVKATLRRNVYDGDGTYVNTELTIRSWSVLRRWKPFPPSWRTTRPIRPLPRMHVLQERSTIDLSTNRRSLSRKIVEYDEIASHARWLWKRRKKTIDKFFALSEASHARVNQNRIDSNVYRKRKVESPAVRIAFDFFVQFNIILRNLEFVIKAIKCNIN